MSLGRQSLAAWRGELNGAPKFPNAAIPRFMWKAGRRLGLEPCGKVAETTQVNDNALLVEMWAESLDRHHWGPDLGGYCLSADDASDIIIIRTITAHDDATPNANATMLGHLMAQHLQVSHTGFLSGVIDLMEPLHVVVVGNEDDPQAVRL
jgi:hypothetical protein